MKAKTKSSRQSKINSESLQEKFNVNVGDIQKAIKGVKKFRAENPKLQNQLFEEERVPLFLQISCVKIPKGYSQILRIPLPHTILTPEDEICLIVPDVKGIKNIEHEKHVEHYEDLLRKGGVTNIKKIMTFHELRTEYETFEQKSRLVDLYDIFLADGRISGRAIKKCGKVFYKKRKVPISVKLYATKLKENIEKALTKVFFHLHLKGNSFTVQFGHDKMKVDDLVENIYSIIEFLDIKFPGGFANIKGIQVSSPRATSIPIYLNFKSPSEVKVAKVKSKRPKAYKSYEDEITTLYNAKVTVRPSGEVLVKRIRKKSKIRNDNVITDKDLINDNKVHIDEARSNENVQKKKSRKRKQTGEATTDHEIKKKKILTTDETYEDEGRVSVDGKPNKNRNKIKKIVNNKNGEVKEIKKSSKKKRTLSNTANNYDEVKEDTTKTDLKKKTLVVDNYDELKEDTTKKSIKKKKLVLDNGKSNNGKIKKSKVNVVHNKLNSKEKKGFINYEKESKKKKKKSQSQL